MFEEGGFFGNLWDTGSSWVSDSWNSLFGSSFDASGLQILDDPGTRFDESMGRDITILDDPGTGFDESMGMDWYNPNAIAPPLADGLLGMDAGASSNTGFPKGSPSGAAKPPQSGFWNSASKAVGAAARAYTSSGSGSGATNTILAAASKPNLPTTPLMSPTRAAQGSGPAATVGPDAVAQWTRIFMGGK